VNYLFAKLVIIGYNFPAMESPEQEPRKEKLYRGIQGIEITSSGWLFKEKELYGIVNKLNEARGNNDQIGIEIYPTNLIVTPYSIKEWEKEYPKAKTTRIHLPFSHNLSESFYLILNDGFRDKIYDLVWLGVFGVAKNAKAVKIAKQLGLEINMHPNVVKGFALEGKLDELKQNVPGVFVENERPYKNERIIFDPLAIRDLIKEYQLCGFIFDVEHADKKLFTRIKKYKDKGIDIDSTLNQTKDVLGMIHIDTIFKNDTCLNLILSKVSQMEFNHPLKIVLDLSPLPLVRMKIKQKLELLHALVETVDSYKEKSEKI